jgi:CRISPR/Cas system-associated exonuclease Cas4 (RecB family)
LEKYFSIQTKNFVINGRADRVDVVDGKTIIVDYKTGKPLRQIEAEESVQLPTYALWVSKIEGMPSEVIGRYIFLKCLDKKNGVLDIEITPDMVDAAMEKYNYVYSEITNGCKFKRNSSYKYCLSCDFRSHCFSHDD